MAIISVQNISKQFTRTVAQKGTGRQGLLGNRHKKEAFFAVHGLTFDVEPGDIYGILGPNGAGKTTLLRMLGGIMTPTSGSIELLGRTLGEDPNRYKKSIGYLSGNTKLYGRLSPRELLSIFGQLYDMQKETVDERIEQLTDLLDLEFFLDSRIDKLSTGQTQRVSIARCLIHSPQLYIFDEPTLGLDVLSSHAIIEFMRKERHSGRAVLYSTHYMEEAEMLCNKIIMLHKGEVIAAGTPEELKQDTHTDSIRDAFIALVSKGGEQIG